MRSYYVSSVAIILFSTLCFVESSMACDLCSIYSAQESHKSSTDELQVSLAEQYTDYGDVRKDGKKIDNADNQYMHSSITQLAVSLGLSDRLSIQGNIPFISRSYRRVDDGVEGGVEGGAEGGAEGGGESKVIDTGRESGIGDIPIIVKWHGYESSTEDSFVSVLFHAGIKLPTGDSDRLRAEGSNHHDEPEMADDHEVEQEEAHHSAVSRHGGEIHGVIHDDLIPSAVHEHDLAIGSGSFDFPLGLNTIARYKKLLFSADAQYIFRTVGRGEYQYGNDFLWRAGVGSFLITNDTYTFMSRFTVSGEHKVEDEVDGIEQNDTYIRAIYVGPELVVTSNDNFSAILGVDHPTSINNSGTQATADYRIRAGITMTF